MPIDRSAVDAFLLEVDHNLLPRLQDQRFTNPPQLIRRYEEAKAAWNDSRGGVSALNEIVNEICIACEFLSSAECGSLSYETPLIGTDRTIDFLVTTTQNRSIYFDVKTVHPDESDAWARYQSMQEHFTPGAELVLDQDWMGGELAHFFIASRERFLEHTLALEDKIETITNRNDFSYALVFCGDGFRWHETDLEDFADFYRTGRHRPDDHFGAVETHYMNEKGLSFRRRIDSFCYFERPLPEIRRTVFHCNVRGWPTWSAATE